MRLRKPGGCLWAGNRSFFRKADGNHDRPGTAEAQPDGTFGDAFVEQVEENERLKEQREKTEAALEDRRKEKTPNQYGGTVI